MEMFEVVVESATVLITSIINAVLPSGTLLPLQHVYQSFPITWSTLPYLGVSLFVAGLFYYYVWLPDDLFKDCSDIGFYDIKGQQLKKESAGEVRRRRQFGDTPPVYPNGWFALFESRDLKAGQVKHVQALGENFAVMRTDAGEVHVLDAYCPHLGANMAVGGVVKGDCLECPFHGWQFRGEDGTCSHIPYSNKVPKGAAVKKWISNEINGFVFVWYHAEGDPPSWQVKSIPEIETGRYWYRGRFEILINAHLEDVCENAGDPAHFIGIHTTSAHLGSNLNLTNRGVHSFLQHSWTVDWKPHSESGESHMSTTFLQHSFRLFHKFHLAHLDVTLGQVGPGIMYVTNTGFRTVSITTPVEPLVIKMVLHNYSLPALFIFSKLHLSFETTMLKRDAMVWNHKKYVMKPLVTSKDDKTIVNHRRWFSQFYSENSPRLHSKNDSMTW